MKWLIAYDAWFEGRVEALLVWLEEWLSISQERVEQGIIVLYLALLIAAGGRTLKLLPLRIGSYIMMLVIMIWLHRKPAASRGATKRYSDLCLIRVLVQIFLLSFAGIFFFAPPHRVEDIENGLAQIIYLVFFYMIDIGSTGKLGRRRKLALAELKKLFGAAWIPKPLLAPR